MPLVLAGDIGGTKTKVALYDVQQGPQAPHAEATYPSARYANLDAIVRDFLADVQEPVRYACFGVAGPVVGGRVTTTNLPWVLDEAELAARLDLQAAWLLNDLVAVANAVPILRPADLHVINAGEPDPTGPIGVIAPGTGLGEAYLIHDGAQYRAYPSEGGHCTFAPTSELEADLLRHLLGHHDHVSFERVCSGIGIPNIYHFLKESGRAPEPDWLAAELAAADDPTPVIMNAARGTGPDGTSCELCHLTLHTFVSILGAEAGNLALKVMATGGVYLGGGIPPRILDALEGDPFRHAFCNKGRLSSVLRNMPVCVILNSDAALLGAAQYGLQRAAE